MNPELIRQQLGPDAQGQRLRIIVGPATITTTLKEVQADTLICQDDDSMTTTIDMLSIAALTVLVPASAAFVTSKHPSLASDAVEAMRKGGPKFFEFVEGMEALIIEEALSSVPGRNQARAARLLGLKATTLNSKIKRYNIQPVGRKKPPAESE